MIVDTVRSFTFVDRKKFQCTALVFRREETNVHPQTRGTPGKVGLPSIDRIGTIPGVEVGKVFRSRAGLALVGVHHPPQAGIDCVECRHPKDGWLINVAVSVIVSGGYEDDYDEGEELMYTGEGGNDSGSKKQVMDQEMKGGNLGLKHSWELQLPVRVSRAQPSNPALRSSPKVYTYDGVYRVVKVISSRGKSKYKVFKFKMVREPNQPPLTWFRGC
ncbi:hypothetical protein R1sor_019855 [Riccia sorocarpa]|uniref:YDG domain-containing protein n=1 Tax=Riccia sorocarpa TaxID=122646 RepID=A0ABD3IDP6_9MARC